MLKPLLATASNILQPEQQPTVKALIGLQTYTTQLRDAVRARQLDMGDKEVQGRLDELVNGFAAAANVITRLLWEADGDKAEMDTHDLHIALKQSIGNFFAVRSLLERSFATRYDKHILCSILPSIPPYHQSFLSPILEHCRRSIAFLKAKPSCPHPQSKLPNSSLQALRDRADTEVTCLLGYLQTINVGLSSISEIGSLNSTTFASKMTKTKGKQMDQDNENRPLRVRMEVMLIKCDLLLSVTNKRMNEVKARAARSMGGEENQDAAEENMKSEDRSRSKSRGKSRSKSVDSMSEIGTNNVVPFCAANSVHPPSDTPSCFIEWEVLTEKSLIECLNFAASCAEDDRIAILTKDIVHPDWLGVASLQQKASTKSKSQSPSPLHPCPSSTNMSNDEDSDLDSSITSFNSEDEGNQDEDSSFRCPLRTLVALHDRYEEQRLAIWLTLPTSGRGKMSAFIRGGKDGAVGRAWDGLGMNIILKIDGSGLIPYGLAPDKLSKWTDLVAVRQAKRIRKNGREGDVIFQKRPLSQSQGGV
ncbi:hypothetical protein D1P53_004226 [Cryptococcus gattii VGV]|nr:hypothetical protein D1P53_004226 [Cryptococcus gattii VGV]